MKVLNVLVMCVVMMFVVACGEPSDRVTSVQWMADGEVAVVNYISAGGKNQTFKIRCKESNVRAPFDYVWEDDCDLNTEVDGLVRDWDNPEDERFEDRRYSGSRGEGYDDDEGIDTGDLALGMVVGGMMASNNTKVVKKKPVRTVVKKKPVKRTNKKTYKSKTTYRSKRK